MRIGIIGAGGMARALGGHWARAGHEVRVGGRVPRRAADTAAAIGHGCAPGSLAEAARFGEVVLVAVRRTGVLEALDAAGAGSGALRGRVVVDCTNPVDEADTFRLVTADGPSMAATIARHSPGAHVAKAFNLGSADLWRSAPTRPEGPLVVPVAADAERAFRATAELADAAGGVAIHWGALDRAGQIEAVAAFGIRLIVEGLTFDAAMPTSQPGPPPGSRLAG